MFSVYYIFLLIITYVFAIITCLGFLVYVHNDHVSQTRLLSVTKYNIFYFEI